MKRILTICTLFLLLVTIFSFGKTKTAIVGRINPTDAGEAVWVISATDSLKTGISMGQFSFDVKPGTYKLVVDARDPYRDVLLENLQVKQDEILDVGEIPLKQ
jgi:hypothetical protein